MPKLAIKIDVDTYQGTKKGIIPLLRLFEKYAVPATFLFSFGPDNTGRAITRVFRKGFIKKCLRSNVAGNYGFKTLMYGTLLPAPIIYKKCANIMLQAKNCGFECGIHSWNHYNWQDNIFKMSKTAVAAEFEKAKAAFIEVYGQVPHCCGAPGWQISPDAIAVEDANNLLYASDTRGKSPFFPKMGGKTFKTLQIPSTLPTLDEVLGVGANTLDSIKQMYLEKILAAEMSVMTIHSELEALNYFDYFEGFIKEAKARNIEFFSLQGWAKQLLAEPQKIQVCEVKMLEFAGRSGLLAQQA